MVIGVLRVRSARRARSSSIAMNTHRAFTCRSKTGETGCTECQPGLSFRLLIKHCLGFFNSMEGRTECSPCPVGSFTFVNRGEVCISCAIGRYQNKTGTSECVHKQTLIASMMFRSFCVRLEHSLTLRGSLCVFCVIRALTRKPKVLLRECLTFASIGASACALCATGTHNNASAASGCDGIRSLVCTYVVL